MHVATEHAAQWWATDRPDATAWITRYQSSLQVRHRTAISQIVGELGLGTLLEVGCHCGPNLIRLATDHPTLKCAGIDVSAQAIDAGVKWAASKGLSARVKMLAARCPQDLETLKTGQYDAVLSCYTLAYLSPADLDGALYELGRLATRAVIIAEPMVLNGQSVPPTLMAGGYSEWAHDYHSALRWVNTLRGWQTRIVPIVPCVDRLNAVLVATRSENMP